MEVGDPTPAHPSPMDRWRTWLRVADYLGPVSPGEVDPPEAREWAEMVRLAARHGLAPLLHHRLRHLGQLECLPGPEAEALAARHADAVGRYGEIGLWALPELMALRDAFGAVVLKGAALAHQIYPSPHLRLFRDLDVLIRPEDRRDSRRMLTGRGWELAGRGRLEDQWTKGPVGPGTLSLDVHTHIGDLALYPVPTVAALWSCRTEALLWGVPFAVLALELSALQMAAQFATNLWYGVVQLPQLVDLSYLVADPRFDRARAEEEAARCGLLGVLAVSTHMAHAAEPLPLPRPACERVLRRLQSCGDRLLARPATAAGRRRVGMLGLAAFDHKRDTVRHVVRRALDAAWSRLTPGGP